MDEVSDRDVVAAVRRFVERDVIPAASELEHNDEYPHRMVATMRELGLFGATIPAEYGGLGLSFQSYAQVMEELSRGWMSLAGVINSHLIMAHVIANHGTEEQRKYFLPAMASGEKRGGLALTEPHAGSDVQSIRTTAKRSGDDYVVNGSKMFITNARHGTMLAVAAKTNPEALPAYAGISMFAVEKSERGPTVSRNLKKLGYKGIDTCEVIFDEVPVPATALIGGVEGQGFKQVMSALEVGRINVASRAVGVAQAAFETAIRYSQQRSAFGKPICQHQAVQLMLADMGTRIEAARLLVANAARKKDAGERCDVEAGMAKLFASEACAKISLDAMRVLGGYGFMAEFPVERFYRDAPLMMIGEGTNEIQALVIARGLLSRYPA
ncbi:MAG: acyl-CoA dehydrogenase family protein [Candidatus Binatus sp.]|uniref:acyl-CoA dehydrogenase family protein n=1 Tax=Candidatus Binatus sp. TaxID=2811406 RepID=UPI002719B481|nr:acyl-CoA dehydrogenase family protein [Candidatus Binatus sp.]MDO8433912.1 acyl-CoA dehydrogenase family protein [Candidatus Binatus sp.]